MERISIFNYEAFYLDFLEGNLGEKDVVLLKEFLAANPDLIEDDESLPIFNEENLHIDTAVKNDLKQYDEEDAIVIDNAEYFMIAESEGLLSHGKSEELEQFINANSELKRDMASYQKVHFSPDLTLEYKHKENLKEKGIVLWPYISVAAAASIVLFFLNWGGVIEEGKSFAKTENKSKIEVYKEVINNPTSVEDVHALQQDRTNLTAGIVNSPVKSNNEVEKMKVHSARQLLTSISDVPKEPLAKSLINENTQNVSVNQVVASTAIMSNPIEPITRFMSEKTKTEIDFKRSEKKADKGRNFFVKIGKFEFSRKRH